MTTLDYIQLLLAAWGAGLATYLGLRELRKEARRLRVFLDHVHWVERHQLIVVNIGHRPVTITDVGVRMIAKNQEQHSDAELRRPIGPDRSSELRGSPTLPLVLTDGESATFLIEEKLGQYLGSGEFSFVAYARDAEGKEYLTRTMRAFDAKYGDYVR